MRQIGPAVIAAHPSVRLQAAVGSVECVPAITSSALAVTATDRRRSAACYAGLECCAGRPQLLLIRTASKAICRRIH